MSSNVGLSTPRGSGTSGYVQRNLSVLKPRAVGVGAPYAPHDRAPPRSRKPDREILNHDRMRDVEVKILELRDSLEDEGKLDEDAIDEECEKLRTRLVRDLMGGKGGGGGGGNAGGKARGGKDGIKRYQVHELAEAKIKESDRLRRALGLKNEEIGDQDGDGGEHPMARQERKKREREAEKAKLDLEREDMDGEQD